MLHGCMMIFLRYSLAGRGSGLGSVAFLAIAFQDRRERRFEVRYLEAGIDTAAGSINLIRNHEVGVREGTGGTFSDNRSYRSAVLQESDYVSHLSIIY